MAKDPEHTAGAASTKAHRATRAHRATKATRRLLTATIGFSVAYFFDPGSGPARRAQVCELVRRPLIPRCAGTPAPAAPAAPDLPRIGLARTHPRPPFQRALHDARAVARA